MKYNAVIFDLDNTLYDYDIANAAGFRAVEDITCYLCNIEPEKFRLNWDKARNDVKKLIPSLAASHSRLLYCKRTLELLNHHPLTDALDMSEAFWNAYFKNMLPFEGVTPTLIKLQSLNIKIGICSDLTARIQLMKLKKLGIEKYIDAIVTSEETGCEKPSKEMFEVITRKMNVEADNCIFVGDDLERDIYGAKSYGMDVLWKTNAESMKNSLNKIDRIESILDYLH